jgi:hypothetical protein
MGNTVPYKSWLERQEAWLLSPLILANNKDSLCHFSAEERDEPIRTYAISSLLFSFTTPPPFQAPV